MSTTCGGRGKGPSSQVARAFCIFKFSECFFDYVEEDKKREAIEEPESQREEEEGEIQFSIGRHVDGRKGGRNEGWSKGMKQREKGKKHASAEEKRREPGSHPEGESVQGATVSVTGCGEMVVVRSQEGIDEVC